MLEQKHNDKIITRSKKHEGTSRIKPSPTCIQCKLGATMSSFLISACSLISTQNPVPASYATVLNALLGLRPPICAFKLRPMLTCTAYKRKPVSPVPPVPLLPIKFRLSFFLGLINHSSCIAPLMTILYPHSVALFFVSSSIGAPSLPVLVV